MLTVFGVAGGVSDAPASGCCTGYCETWVAAVALAPIVLMYPLSW